MPTSAPTITARMERASGSRQINPVPARSRPVIAAGKIGATQAVDLPLFSGSFRQFSAMTLTPPENGKATARRRAQELLAKKSLAASDGGGQKIARLLHRVTPDAQEESCAWWPSAKTVGHAGCFPAANTRAVICNAASRAGVHSAEPPAHESPPAHRVLASAARTVRRPGSSNITASCVRGGVGAVTPAADPACAPGRAARAPACRHPSRPPVLAHGHQAHAKKLARESNLA